MVKIKLWIVLLLVLIAAAVSGPAAASGSVIIAVPTDPDSFDPHRSLAAASGEISFNIFEGLVRPAADGTIAPGLAETWDVSADGLHYVFVLRDAFFHDGSPVRAEDVVFSLNRLRDPARSVRAGEYTLVEKVEAAGREVHITLRQPHGPFLASLAEPFAAVIPEDAVEIGQNPIGTGPFQFVEWNPNQEIKLQRFAQHWAEERPYFDEVIFRIYPDDHAAILSLKAGQVDVIPRLDPSLVHQVETDPNLDVISGPMNLVQVIALNNAFEPFQDVRVRRALALAIDREEIIYGAAWDHGTALYSGLSPAMSAYYYADLETGYRTNRDEAKALLEEAGYESLQFTLDLPAPYAIHVQTGEMAAQQLAAVGVQVDLRIIEWGTWLERVYTQRDYEASIVGLAGRLDPHGILVRYTTDSSRNFFNFSHPGFDELIAEAMTAAEEKRPEMYREAQAILADQAASIFVMDPQQIAVVRRGLQGWQNYPVYVIDAAALYR